jgi:predicted enzyme related to lactoylglutathione lyase
MISVSVSVDVPNMVDGIRFYERAFGFAKVAEPFPGVVVLKCGDAQLLLLEKAAGSQPSPNTQETRHYARHWTPVHVDFHVDDFKETLAKAIEAGAKQEQLHENAKHGSVAFCSDPFGHGFCLIEKKRR